MCSQHSRSRPTELATLEVDLLESRSDDPAFAFVSRSDTFYEKKEVVMSRFTKWLFAVWIMLAIACFVGAFFTPVMWIKVIGLVFGGLNSLVILSWGLAAIQAMIENKRLKIEE